MRKNGKKIIVSLIIGLFLGSSIGYSQNFSYDDYTNNTSYNNQYNGNEYYTNNYRYSNNYLEYLFNTIKFTPTKPQPPVEDVEEPDNKPVPEVKPNKPSPDTNTETSNSVDMEVVRLVNIERQKSGLASLTYSKELSKVAQAKSQDMANNNYFSHNSPTYGDPFAMMRSFGIQYRTAGENIAKGYSSAQSVVKGWMNSSGHRENILNPSFGKIGIGYVNANGSSYWTQMFTD